MCKCKVLHAESLNKLASHAHTATARGALKGQIKFEKFRATFWESRELSKSLTTIVLLMFWTLIRKQFKSASVIPKGGHIQVQGRRETDSLYPPRKLVPKTISYYTLEIDSKNN